MDHISTVIGMVVGTVTVATIVCGALVKVLASREQAQQNERLTVLEVQQDTVRKQIEKILEILEDR